MFVFIAIFAKCAKEIKAPVASVQHKKKKNEEIKTKLWMPISCKWLLRI